MPICRRKVHRTLLALALAAGWLRADPGDVDSSHDYAAFPRVPGFVITDYDEDNPAQFDFPIAAPTALDANHVETTHVKGHRYVIRYELGAGGRPISLFQTQLYYEKLAATAGFTVVKSGAVGEVTETFYRGTSAEQTWIYLEPAITVNVLTVVESSDSVLPSPPPIIASIEAPPPAPAPAPVVAPVVTPAPAVADPTLTPPPEIPEPSAPEPTQVPTPPSTSPPTPPPAPTPPPVDPNDDSLYSELSASGRVVLPFVFQPGKDELDDSSQPLIDRVVAMMNNHPDLFLRIEGHTDNVGDADDNMRLSAQRAFAVRAKVIAADIDSKRLDAVGVGGLQPLTSNRTAEGREKNRRIELVVWKNNPAFHAPAPNGQNYYPAPASSSSGSRAGL